MRGHSLLHQDDDFAANEKTPAERRRADGQWWQLVAALPTSSDGPEAGAPALPTDEALLDEVDGLGRPSGAATDLGKPGPAC